MDATRVFKNPIFLITFTLLLAVFSISATTPSSPPLNDAVIKNQKTTSSSFLGYNGKDDGRRLRVMLANMKKRRQENNKMKTTKNNNNKDEYGYNNDNRVFSAMLPKGNVPPSGSSSCHNGYNPNSVASICTFSRHRPQKIENGDP